MKDKFKVKWAQNGWGIVHSRLGIFWTVAGDKVYRDKSHADKLVADLNETGKCPDSWYEEKDKK